MKIYIDDCLEQDTSKKVHKHYYDNFKQVTDASQADIILCANESRDYTNYKAKYIVCNMTNTDHIRHKSTMISLKDHTPYLTRVTSTAEHALWLMLSLLRRTSRSQNPGRTLSKMKVGIIGVGRIGAIVERLLKELGCIVFTHDINGMGNYPLDSLLKDSDIITLHTSITKQMTPILNEYTLYNVKKGVYIVNTSRPEAIDITALYQNREKVAGFASDFPISYDLGIPTVITNHTGGYSIDDLKSTSIYCYGLLLKEIEDAKNVEQ